MLVLLKLKWKIIHCYVYIHSKSNSRIDYAQFINLHSKAYHSKANSFISLQSTVLVLYIIIGLIWFHNCVNAMQQYAVSLNLQMLSLKPESNCVAAVSRLNYTQWLVLTESMVYSLVPWKYRRPSDPDSSTYPWCCPFVASPGHCVERAHVSSGRVALVPVFDIFTLGIAIFLGDRIERIICESALIFCSARLAKRLKGR